LAFTQDGISYIGTDGRDSLVLTTGVGSWEFPTGGPAFIEALGDDDQVTFNGNAAEVTLVAGDGADVTMINNGGVNVTGQLSASSINGNGGDDTTMWNNITNSSIFGGQGNDTMVSQASLGGLTTNASEIQGNKGDDTITLTGSVTFSTVYGGRDNDDIMVASNGFQVFSNSFQGNKGDDCIIIDIDNGAGNDVYGGQDDDLISALDSRTDGSMLLSGDLGNDTIFGSGFDFLDVSTGAQILSGGDDRDILIYNGNTNTTMIGGDGPDVFRINALSGGNGTGSAPFIEDFDTSEDNIEINVSFFGIAFDVSGNPVTTTTPAPITISHLQASLVLLTLELLVVYRVKQEFLYLFPWTIRELELS